MGSGGFFFKTQKAEMTFYGSYFFSIKHTRCCGELRDGLKRNAGQGEPCGMKHISFLDFLLLFYQEKSKRKVVQRSFGSNQSTNIEKSS